MDRVNRLLTAWLFEFISCFGPSDGKQLDDALLEQQREAYKVHGVDENQPVDLKTRQKKRKQDANGGEEVSLHIRSFRWLSVVLRPETGIRITYWSDI